MLIDCAARRSCFSRDPTQDSAAMIVTVRSRRPEAVWPHGAFFFFLLRIKMRKMGSPMQMKMATLAPVPIARKVLTIGVYLVRSVGDATSELPVSLRRRSIQNTPRS
jgi:hypothetical protein